MGISTVQKGNITYEVELLRHDKRTIPEIANHPLDAIYVEMANRPHSSKGVREMLEEVGEHETGYFPSLVAAGKRGAELWFGDVFTPERLFSEGLTGRETLRALIPYIPHIIFSRILARRGRIQAREPIRRIASLISMGQKIPNIDFRNAWNSESVKFMANRLSSFRRGNLRVGIPMGAGHSGIVEYIESNWKGAAALGRYKKNLSNILLLETGQEPYIVHRARYDAESGKWRVSSLNMLRFLNKGNRLKNE